MATESKNPLIDYLKNQFAGNGDNTNRVVKSVAMADTVMLAFKFTDNEQKAVEEKGLSVIPNIIENYKTEHTRDATDAEFISNLFSMSGKELAFDQLPVDFFAELVKTPAFINNPNQKEYFAYIFRAVGIEDGRIDKLNPIFAATNHVALKSIFDIYANKNITDANKKEVATDDFNKSHTAKLDEFDDIALNIKSAEDVKKLQLGILSDDKKKSKENDNIVDDVFTQVCGKNSPAIALAFRDTEKGLKGKGKDAKNMFQYGKAVSAEALLTACKGRWELDPEEAPNATIVGKNSNIGRVVKSASSILTGFLKPEKILRLGVTTGIRQVFGGIFPQVGAVVNTGLAIFDGVRSICKEKKDGTLTNDRLKEIGTGIAGSVLTGLSGLTGIPFAPTLVNLGLNLFKEGKKAQIEGFHGFELVKETMKRSKKTILVAGALAVTAAAGSFAVKDLSKGDDSWLRGLFRGGKGGGTKDAAGEFNPVNDNELEKMIAAKAGTPASAEVEVTDGSGGLNKSEIAAMKADVDAAAKLTPADAKAFTIDGKPVQLPEGATVDKNGWWMDAKGKYIRDTETKKMVFGEGAKFSDGGKGLRDTDSGIIRYNRGAAPVAKAGNADALASSGDSRTATHLGDWDKETELAMARKMEKMAKELKEAEDKLRVLKGNSFNPEHAVVPGALHPVAPAGTGFVAPAGTGFVAPAAAATNGSEVVTGTDADTVIENVITGRKGGWTSKNLGSYGIDFSDKP